MRMKVRYSYTCIHTLYASYVFLNIPSVYAACHAHKHLVCRCEIFQYFNLFPSVYDCHLKTENKCIISLDLN